MRKVSIKKEFSQDYITRVAGERLRNLILEAHQDNQSIEVDFTGVVVASTSFFDESIAKLAEEGWDRAMLEKFVTLKGLNKMDNEVLQRVCKYRGITAHP
jgi:hypothetical protein